MQNRGLDKTQQRNDKPQIHRVKNSNWHGFFRMHNYYTVLKVIEFVSSISLLFLTWLKDRKFVSGSKMFKVSLGIHQIMCQVGLLWKYSLHWKMKGGKKLERPWNNKTAINYIAIFGRQKQLGKSYEPPLHYWKKFVAVFLFLQESI